MKYDVISPMMGVVSNIYVESGSEVEEGFVLAEIECMKTLFPIHAPATGVLFLDVAPGAQVGQDEQLGYVES